MIRPKPDPTHHTTKKFVAYIHRQGEPPMPTIIPPGTLCVVLDVHRDAIKCDVEFAAPYAGVAVIELETLAA